MEKMVGKTSENTDKKNRHGSPLTVEQIVKLEEARHGLHRKLNRSERFRSLYGDDIQLAQYLASSGFTSKANGFQDNKSKEDSISAHVPENNAHNGETEKTNHSFKLSRIIAPDSRSNICFENGFSDVYSESSALCHPRSVTVERLPSGEFDLLLKDVTIVLRGLENASKQEQLVTLIESGSPLSVFLPGDRLLEVNESRVEGMSCSSIWALINKSGNKMRLKVQPIPELNELSMRTSVNGENVSLQDHYIQTGTLKRTGSMRFRFQKDRQKEEDSGGKEHRSGMMAWLVHEAGFTSAEIVGPSPSDPTKIIIRLQNSDTELHVSQKDLEKSNPPSCDRLEDLSSLPYLNESSFLNTLKQRFGASLTHTYVGQTLIVFNPMRSLSVYSDKVIAVFEGCHTEDMPPHIYATAQSAYRNMMDTGQSQSLVLMGHSGSGKTTNLKQILYYYTVVAARHADKAVTANKLNAVFVLLEAFGNCRTIQNASASRFLQTTSVNFDRGGVIAGVSIQAMMLERTRILRRPEGEPTFHIFYQFLNGLEDNLRRELFLENLTNSNLFLTPLRMPAFQQKAALTWNKIYQAMCTLNFSPDEIKAVCSILASIYHLGVAGSVKGSGGRRHQFARPSSARRAANLLGSTLNELSDLIFNHQHLLSSFESVTRIDLIEDFVICLYSELFQAVVSLINKSLTSKCKGDYCIMLLDSAGFQDPTSCGRQTGSSFEDLCSNYLHERLQSLFKDTVVTSRLELYRKENIDCDLSNVTSVLTSPTVALVDGKARSQAGLSGGKLSKSSASTRLGLFLVLDEVRRNSSASDETFRQTFVNQYKAVNDYGGEWVLSEGDRNLLRVNHVFGNSPVTYDVQGWIKSTRHLDLYQQTLHKNFLQSNRQEIRNLLKMGDSGADLQNDSVCRRIASAVDAVIEKLRKNNLRFILCLSPLHSAGLSDVTEKIRNKISSQKSTLSDDVDEQFFDDTFVRAQIRGYELTNVARLYRQGFPENMSFEDFTRRYGILVPPELRLVTDDVRESVQQILDYMNINKSSYQLGRTQVFFQPSALSLLNDEREEKLSAWMEKLQTICRGWLGRRKLDKLKLQRTCIECIQNNVRIMASVKDWPWWKLFSKVRPLVQVNLLEQEKKLKAEEMEELKKKLEKIEREKNELKEAVSLMGTAKGRRRGTFDEDGFDDVTESSFPRTSSRFLSTFDSDGEDDDENYNQLYLDKYENAKRQGDLERRKMQREHEDTVEDLISSKKLMEKKLNHALEDAEEQQTLLASINEKSLQYSRDITDLKSHLSEQKSQNEILEEKQKQCDAEIKRLSDLLKTERTTKEKLQQENEKIEDQKYSAEQKLRDILSELEREADRNKQLKQELEFVSASKKGDEELTLLQKLRADLERKCQKQESELRNQEAAIKHLEMEKQNLEILQGKLKQQQSKIQREKDEALEEQKKSLQKKIQGIVLQLEEESAEKKKLLQEKIELDRRLLLMVEPNKEKEMRLKRKVKQMKVLLQDFHLANPAGLKAMKQLKEEIEDANLAAAAALKAKRMAELELFDLQTQMEIVQRSKLDAEERSRRITLDQTELMTKLDSAGDDYNDLLKKYKALVLQNSLELTRLQEQSEMIEDLLSQLEKRKEEADVLQSRLHFLQSSSVSKQIVSRLEAKISELESVVEMEQTNRSKTETNLSRLKAQLENELTAKRQTEAEQNNIVAVNKKLEREIQELKDQLRHSQMKESELALRNKQIENRLNSYELECEKHNEELQLTNRRLTELQRALENDQLELDSEEEEEQEIDDESDDEIDEVSPLPAISYNSILLSPKRSLEEQSDA